MYRYLVSAILGMIITFIVISKIQHPAHENYLLSAFLLILFTYFTIVSIIGFFVARSIKKKDAQEA